MSRIELKIEKVSRIGAEREKADGIIVLYPNRKLHDRQVRVFLLKIFPRLCIVHARYCSLPHTSASSLS